MEIKTQFDGSVIRNRRVGLGISREDLVFRMRDLGSRNVTSRTLAKWEAGETKPDADYVPFLASVLDCDVTAFFVPRKLTA